MYPAFDNFAKFLSVSPNSLRSGQWMVFVNLSLSRMQRKLLDYSERMWFPNLWTFGPNLNSMGNLLPKSPYLWLKICFVYFGILRPSMNLFPKL